MRSALRLAIGSMDLIPPNAAHDKLHRLLASAAGAFGGLLGPLTLLAELPVTTVLMLRSIADIAHGEGEDLNTPEARLACVQVFALGGRTGKDRGCTSVPRAPRTSRAASSSSVPPRRASAPRSPIA
jgi:hypothetical protein